MRQHWALLDLVQMLDSDYEPYGQAPREGSDCSCGCYWFVRLEHPFTSDWGVCSNAKGPRKGLLTFEHQGCPFYEQRKGRRTFTDDAQVEYARERAKGAKAS